jgi:hypothetical protein
MWVISRNDTEGERCTGTRNNGRQMKVGWRFEVPKVVIMNIIFWNEMPCSLVDVYCCFGESATSIFRAEEYSGMGNSDGRDKIPKRTVESKAKGEGLSSPSKGLFNRAE